MDCVSCLLHRDYPLVLLAGLKGYGNCSDEYVTCGRHCINFVHIRISRNWQYFNTVSTHIGSKIFVAVYGESVVAEPICTAHARDLLVCQCCCAVYKCSL